MNLNDVIFVLRHAGNPNHVYATVQTLDQAVDLTRRIVRDNSRRVSIDVPPTPGIPYHRVGLHMPGAASLFTPVFFVTEEKIGIPLSHYSGNGMGFVSQNLGS